MSQKLTKHSIRLFLILSVLAHFGVYVGLFLVKAPEVPKAKAIVEVEYLSPPPSNEDHKQDREKSKVNALNQIVEQKDQLNAEVDERTKLLSAFNQRVEQETRAANSGKFNNSAKGGNPEEEVADLNPEPEPVKKEKSKRKNGELPSLKDLSPKFAGTPGPKGPDAKDKGEASQSDDYLKDVAVSMQTLLSTREFVYYSYYARIKESIRQRWEPDIRQKVKIIYRQGRNIASAKDRVTQVLVTLNSNGDLITVQIISQSGIEQLDSAAIEAFRAAAPFPNPPKGMIETDGTIKIRWDFVLEV